MQHVRISTLGRLLAGMIVLGSSLLAGGATAVHAQQAGRADPTTSAWYSATYLTHPAPQSVAPRAVRTTASATASLVAGTEGWYRATYLPHPPIMPSSTRWVSLAVLHMRAVRPEADPTTSAWYSATYLPYHPASVATHPLTLAPRRVRPGDAGSAPVAGPEGWYVASYLGQPAQ